MYGLVRELDGGAFLFQLPQLLISAFCLPCRSFLTFSRLVISEEEALSWTQEETDFDPREP